MDPRLESILLARRQFLTSFASGVGGVALAHLLAADGYAAPADIASPADSPRSTARRASARPLDARQGHFPATARACIFIFLAGGPSQLDLFDPKPALNRLDGQPLPESMTEQVRFAFIQKETARLLGSSRTFRPHGECGMELSDLLPYTGGIADEIALVRSLHTDAFNHHPAQLTMNTGVPMFGRPSIGSWLLYGLGSSSQDLPGYVVLSAGRGTSGGASNWSSGFLPSTYEGVLLRNQGDPVLHLSSPSGLSREVERKSLDALAALNRRRLAAVDDPQIASRIEAYELAFRMQAAAPELIDLASESQATRDLYGVDREDGDRRGVSRSGGPGQYRQFATNCLLARRLVERGVRFVNLYHASWDHHSELDAGLRYNCGMADQPVAALVKDLKQRGLLDSTLVVFAGEFGRTPLGENRRGKNTVTGRDHHPFAFSIWLAGGGIRGGQVLGRTDELGWNVVEDPIHINDLHATLLHQFGLDHTRLTYRFQGRDFRLTDVAGRVVDKLLA